MYCKLEGGSGNYVSYAEVDPSDLSKIVEIIFGGLKGNQFKEAVRTVDWNTLTNLKKIHGINSEFKGYSFPRNSLPKLEEIEFTTCRLSAETLKSLLDAVPDIDTAQNFKFAWDMFSSFSYFLSDDDYEVEAFQSESDRIKIIQAAQKKHERSSGETTVPDDEREEETDLETGKHEQFPPPSLTDDEDADFSGSIDGSSESGTSNSSELFGHLVNQSITEDDDTFSETSNDEYLSDYAVASSRKKPTANSRALDEVFRRNLDPRKASRLDMSDAASYEGSIKISRVHPVSFDDSTSDDSLRVFTKPKKSPTYGKTNRTMSDSTLSEMDVRDRGETTVGHRVEVESWDGANEIPLVAPLLMQAVTSDSVKKIVVTWGQDSSSSMSLTLKQFKELPTETKQDIQTMTIIGGGSGSSNVVSAIDWSNLSGLESLTISNAAVVGVQSFGDVDFSNLKSINFKNCRIGSSAIEGFVNESSPQLRQFNMVECLANEEEIPFIQELQQKVTSRRPMSLNAGYLDDGDDDLDVDIPLSSRDSGHTIACFIESRGWVDYTGLSSAQKQTVTGIHLTGKRLDADATHAVDWSQFPNLTYLGIVNSTITELESSREKRMLFPNMETIEMYDCRVTSDAVMSFWADSGEYLTEFTVRDPRNSQGVLIAGQEQEDFESMVAEVNTIQVQFPPPPPPPPHSMASQDRLNRRSATSQRSLKPTGANLDSELHPDELSLQGDLSSTIAANGVTKIRCKTSNSNDWIDYDQVQDLALITAVIATASDSSVSIMDKIDWGRLPNLEHLYIKGAKIDKEGPLTSLWRSEDNLLFPLLGTIRFEKCRMTVDALDAFYKSSDKTILKRMEVDGPLDVKGRKMSEDDQAYIDYLMRNVNPIPSRDSGHTNSLRMDLSESGRSDSRTPRILRRAATHSQYEAPIRTQTASRVHSGPGAAATRTSLFTPHHAPHGTTGGLPSVRTAGASARNFQKLFKRSREPELVVNSESPNSRDFQTLLHDTQKACETITQKSTLATGDYVWYENKRDQTAGIEYRHENGRTTPILDANIDTVKVHRGWKKVDRTMSHVTRAQIVLASLGIPPCPPDIAISNDRSGLGRAIREQFNQLKLADAEIYVRRIDW